MVGYRGWTRHGVTQDSAATYTERFLMAFGRAERAKASEIAFGDVT